MRTSQLEYFVAAAESLSFTEAAETCHVAQPAISQQIRKLEDELGFELFTRLHNNLVLTDAGALYYREATEVLHRLASARERGRQVASGTAGVLTIGACGATQGSDLAAIERFRTACPDVALRLAGVNTRRQVEQLVQGEFDVYYTDTSQLEGVPGVRLARRAKRDLCVMANRANPLARRRSVSFDEVAAQTLIFAEPSSAAGPSPLAEGPGPRIYTDTQENVQLMVRLDMGVALAPNSVASSVSDDIALIPTRGPWPQIELAWAYLASNANPALRAFLDCVEDADETAVGD